MGLLPTHRKHCIRLIIARLPYRIFLKEHLLTGVLPVQYSEIYKSIV